MGRYPVLLDPALVFVMNLRTSLLLIVILCTLGGLWFATAGGPRGSRGGASQGDPLFPSSPLAVRVERGDEGYLLRREGGFWSQVSPEWFPLSEEAGREVARALAGAVVENKSLPGKGGPTLREVALEEASSAVEVVGPEGLTRVALGESTPGGASYALVEESQDPLLRGHIVTLPEGLHRFVYSRRTERWFDRRLPLPPLASVVGMSVAEGERMASELLRGEDGRWHLADDGAPVRPEVIEGMSELTREVRVREFLGPAASSAGLAVFGLRSPSAVWTLTEATGRTTRLVLGRNGGLGDDSVYGQLERIDGDVVLASPVLRLPPAVSRLAIARDGLTDPRVFPLELDRVRAVRLRPIDGPEVNWDTDASTGSLSTEADRVLKTMLGLTGERRVHLPERLYERGDFGDLTAGGIDVGNKSAIGVEPERPRGYTGSIVVEHGLIAETKFEVLRRRGDWVLRQTLEGQRVDHELDEESEDRFDEVVLPHLRSPTP